MCPECGGRSNVIDNSYNSKCKELYRKRKCEECGTEFFTVEFEAVCNRQFKREWWLYHKKKKRT